eukprot:gene205-369_t
MSNSNNLLDRLLVWGLCHGITTCVFVTIAVLVIAALQAHDGYDNMVGITIKIKTVAFFLSNSSTLSVTEYTIGSYSGTNYTMNRAHYSRASPYSLYVTSIESPSSGTFSYRLHNRDRNVDKFELLSKLNKEGGGTESVAHESTYEPVDIQMGEHVYLAESGLMTSYNLSNGSYFHVEQFLYASTDEESAVYNLTAALDVHHNSKTRYQYHNRSVVFACITMVKYGSREDSPTAVGYSVVRVNEMNAWDEEDDSSESQGDNRYGTYKLAEDAMISSTVPFLSIISHDIDKDGNLDVIVGTQGGFFDCEDDCDRAGGIYALYGTADPLLTDVVDIRNFSDGTVSGSNSFGYNHVLDLHVDDIDEDGDVDMVVSMKPNSTTYEIHLYLCNGNRSFSSTTVLRTGLANVSESQPRQVRILDMNNDGLKDVVFASTAAEFVVVDFIYRWQYKGPSNISFVEQLQPVDGNLRFDHARIIHETEWSVFNMDAYPPLTSESDKLESNKTELAISQIRKDNISSVQCLQFSSD